MSTPPHAFPIQETTTHKSRTRMLAPYVLCRIFKKYKQWTLWICNLSLSSVICTPSGCADSESIGSSNSLLKLCNSHVYFHAYIRVIRCLLSLLWFYLRLPFHTVPIVATMRFCLMWGGTRCSFYFNVICSKHCD